MDKVDKEPWEAYTEEQRDEILDKMFYEMACNGASLRSLLKQDWTPDAHTFYEWCDKVENRAQRYMRASRLRAEHMVDEMLEIADQSENDTYINEATGKVKTDWEVVGRSTLRVNTRKWILSKLNPQKYGDKIDVTSGGKPVAEKVSVEFKDFSE